MDHELEESGEKVLILALMNDARPLAEAFASLAEQQWQLCSSSRFAQWAPCTVRAQIQTESKRKRVAESWSYESKVVEFNRSSNTVEL